MLRGIHKASSTWLGKVVMATIMGFLVISFAIWGIGDIFRGVGRNEVAKVGGSEISIEQFRQYYNDRLQQIAQQARRPISPDQSRALGLDRQILGQMIAETTLTQKARDMRLELSDAEIAARITNDPNFRGPDGRFDRTRFQMIINQANFTESRYVQEQRNVLLRRQLAQSIGGGLTAPKTAIEAVNRFRNEKRSVDYLALGPAQAGEVPAPSADDLKQYFEERKALFRAPEYRKITLLSLSPADLATPDAVSDADAKAYYERHKAMYGKLERREVRQIVFANAEDAAAARAKIAGGASFDDVIKERGLSPADTDLGMLTRAEIIDPAVAEATFALKSGEVSAPVKGTFGTVLVTVGKIEPGEQKSYEEVAGLIKRELAEERARAQVNELRDKIEDERASGATLTETAKKLGLKAVTIEAVDRSGRAPDGKPVAGLPQGVDVVAAAFNTDVGVDTEALQLSTGGYLYVDVNGIVPSRERTLDEMKDKVETAWHDDEVAKRLTAKTDAMLAKLKSGATLEQVASEAGVQVQKGADLQRGRPSGFVPAKVVQAAFATAQDEPAATAGDKATERYVYKVTAVTDPPLDPNSQETKSIAATLETSYADDLIGQYIARLEHDYGVTINQAALNQVVGGTSDPGS